VALISWIISVQRSLKQEVWSQSTGCCSTIWKHGANK